MTVPEPRIEDDGPQDADDGALDVRTELELHALMRGCGC